MKILIVSHEFPPIGGGGANACYYLTKEFEKLGNEVAVVTASYKGLMHLEQQGNLKIIRVKALRKQEDKSTFLEMFTFLCSAFLTVSKMVKKEKFDICQVFFGIPSGPIGIYLKKRYGIPYVIRFGGGDIPGAQKRFSFVYKILSPIIRSIWKNADALVANSEVLKQRAEQFDSRYPIKIIPNGVDCNFFCRDEKIEKKDSFARCNILFVSRLIQGKGLQYIIPLIKQISDRCEESCGKKVFLTIVGDGPYREELERITAEYNVGSYISFEGKKTKKELYSYYNNADLFILPSESEGMPNVVLEAMATGLPIIMTPCGGSKELIQGNGYVVKIDVFADTIIEICCDEVKRLEMGRQSAHLAKTKFSWHEKAEDYLNIFEDISRD